MSTATTEKIGGPPPATRPQAEGGLARVKAKLEASLARGDFYEAHQMYRTLHFRLLAKKSYAELSELLYSGAKRFAETGQQQSAVDIAILYVDALTAAKSPVDEKTVEKISQLFEKIGPSVAERENFLINAVRWSAGEGTQGDPLLHKNIAHILRKEKNHHGARQHFFRSNDGASFAAMLVELQKDQGPEDDADGYIANAILQLLCRRKLQLARDTFAHYVGSHPATSNESGPSHSMEFLNFIRLLLRAIEEKNTSAFNDLSVTYEQSIKRDPALAGYMRKIGKMWFDIDPPKSQMQNGLFGNLIQTLLSGMEGDDFDEDPVFHFSQNRIQSEDVE